MYTEDYTHLRKGRQEEQYYEASCGIRDSYVSGLRVFVMHLAASCSFGGDPVGTVSAKYCVC